MALLDDVSISSTIVFGILSLLSLGVGLGRIKLLRITTPIGKARLDPLFARVVGFLLCLVFAWFAVPTWRPAWIPARLPNTGPRDRSYVRVALPFHDEFEGGTLADWCRRGQNNARLTEDDSHSPHHCLRIDAACTMQLFVADTSAAGRRLLISAWIKPIDVPPPAKGEDKWLQGQLHFAYDVQVNGAPDTRWSPLPPHAQVFNSTQVPPVWTRHSWIVDVPQGAENPNFLVGVSGRRGSVYVDDVRIDIIPVARARARRRV